MLQTLERQRNVKVISFCQANTLHLIGGSQDPRPGNPQVDFQKIFLVFSEALAMMNEFMYL